MEVIIGQTILGGSEVMQSDLLNPDQKSFLSSLFSGQGQAGGAMSQFLQPFDPEQMQGVFQKSIVDPAMQTYNQQVIPGIQQQFGDQNAGASSALNQALAASAQNLGTQLGSQYGNFYNQSMGRTQNALQQMIGASMSPTYENTLVQNQGILPGIIDVAKKFGGF